jgi:6-phosphogluconolactonase
MKPEIVISNTRALTGAAVAAEVARLSAQAVAERGRFTVALSGGSLVEMIAPGLLERSRSGEVNWPAWQVFWADERCVPSASPDSNYAMAEELLFRHVPLPKNQIYTLEEARGPEGAATAYEAFLQRFFALAPGQPPRFDLILLGMGEDGHIASLFPGHPLLDETRRRVVPVTDSPKPPPERVTLTLPVINNACHIIFVTAGAGKAGVLRQVLGTNAQGEALPARRVSPAYGTLQWFIDADAAKQLGDAIHEHT